MIARDLISKLSTRRSLIFLWLIINVLQGAFTELADDEAYYWVYAQHLDFGYFDHPPMIALLIKFGYSLFQNELGVRLFVILSGGFLLHVLGKLTNNTNFLLLFLLFCSITSFQVYSFIAVPDAPMLLFSATFFLSYKRYLEKDTPKTVLVLALNIALLLYSKYHGILIVFFTIISNRPLLRKKSFYATAVLTILFYLPHIIWQIRNGFPSYEFHILNKSQTPYNFFDTINFIPGTLLICGPLVSWFLLYLTLKSPSVNLFERALKYSLVGPIIFFLVSTFNAGVEPNWLAIITVPLLLFSHKFLIQNTKHIKLIRRFAAVSIVLFFIARVHLIYKLIPDSWYAKTEFHGNEQWAGQVKEKANGRPVVFVNSYQKAAKYNFYSGETAMSLNNIFYRRNQYDLWNIEESLRGKNVFLIPNWEIDTLKSFETVKGKTQFLIINNFRSYNKVLIHLPVVKSVYAPGEKISLPLVMENGYNSPVHFGLNKDYPVSLVYDFFEETKFAYENPVLQLNDFVLDKTHSTNIEIQTPDKEGIYYLRVSLKQGWLPAGINSRLIRLEIKK